MRTLLLAFVCLVSMAGAAQAENGRHWNKKDIALECVYLSLLYFDLNQTIQTANNPDLFYENNPILGRHPTEEEVIIYFGLVGVLFQAGAAHFLPEKYRFWFITSGLVIEGYFVINNATIGLEPW